MRETRCSGQAAHGVSVYHVALNLEGAGVIFEPPSGTIPYRPESKRQVAENFARRATADPDMRCFQPGVPRAVLMPYQFQILQNDRAVYIVYERARA